MRLIAFLASTLVPALAAAQSLHTEIAGTSLKIDGPCAAQVGIRIDPSLAGRVVLDATADRAEEIAALRTETVRDTATIRRAPEECPDGRPTLKLAVRIPPRTPIAIDDGGTAAYQLPDTEAPLAIDSSGSMSLRAGAIGPLSLDNSGSATIDIGRISGPAQVDVSGSGDITIHAGDIDALNVDASGSGRLRYGSGTIRAVQISSSGNTDITIGATVGAVSADLSGSGMVRLHRVTGPVSQDSEGAGQMIIENRSP